MTQYRTIVHTYWCDHEGCTASFEEHGLAREAWWSARQYGWRSRQGKHSCGDHSSPDSGSTEEKNDDWSER